MKMEILCAMPGETLPHVDYEQASVWRRFSFAATGFWVCLFRGRLDRYAYLLAQARWETANYTSHWFLDAGPWCMHVGSLTKRRSGAVNGDGGQLAKYSGPIRWMNAWNDRLDWDEAKNVAPAKDCRQYVANVVNAGWFGTGTSMATHASYADGVASMMQHVHWFPKLITSTLGMAMAFGPFAAIPGWVFAISITLALLWVGYLVVKQLIKKRIK